MHTCLLQHRVSSSLSRSAWRPVLKTLTDMVTSSLSFSRNDFFHIPHPGSAASTRATLVLYLELFIVCLPQGYHSHLYQTTSTSQNSPEHSHTTPREKQVKSHENQHTEIGQPNAEPMELYKAIMGSFRDTWTIMQSPHFE